MESKSFRLATLLRLRENARDQCRQELAESRRKDEEAKEQQVRLDTEQRALQSEERRDAGPGEINVDRLREVARCISSLRTRRAEIQRRRESIADEIGTRRRALIEADRGVRVLEKLRERYDARRRREDERQQTKQFDESALRQWVA